MYAVSSHGSVTSKLPLNPLLARHLDSESKRLLSVTDVRGVFPRECDQQAAPEPSPSQAPRLRV